MSFRRSPLSEPWRYHSRIDYHKSFAIQLIRGKSYKDVYLGSSMKQISIQLSELG